MLEKIVRSLRAQDDIQDWTARHVRTESVQWYVLPDGVEAQREVEHERFVVDVLRRNRGPNGDETCGVGNATILLEEELDPSIEQAVAMAGLVHNPPHGVPDPVEVPEVSLVDPNLHEQPAETLRSQEDKLRKAIGRHGQVQLASAEFFADLEDIHLVNSRGIDARQQATKVYVEWFLTAEADGKRVESYTDLTRRRADDLHIAREADRKAAHAADLLKAVPPQPYRGPVVVRESTLASMMTSIVLQRLSSAEAKYKGITPWEVGKPVFPAEAERDDITLWADRRLPFGANSNRFDREGLPAKRVLLIEDGILKAFTASQRFAEYLDLPPTGAFGNVELAAGEQSVEALISEPHIEIAAFSWFFPDVLSGEFASEVRLGYIVDEEGRRPFRGGMLVGNLLKALSNVRLSSETGFYGDYVGPIAARFGDLRLTQG